VIELTQKELHNIVVEIIAILHGQDIPLGISEKDGKWHVVPIYVMGGAEGEEMIPYNG